MDHVNLLILEGHDECIAAPGAEDIGRSESRGTERRLFRAADRVRVQGVPRLVASPSPAFLSTIAVLLALLHAVLAVTASAGKSMTSDEIAHFTAGQAYNTRGDFRLQPENGNLPQRLAALPMTVAGVPLPPPTLASWQTADVWSYGHTFFYASGILADQWMFLGRAIIALVSAATALLVFGWSRALFGWRGGFVSLALFVFCPAFLAHGALATSDVVMTFFFLAAVGAWWRHLERPGVTWTALSCLALGGAFVAKFSAVLLPFMLGLIGLGWAWGEARKHGWRPVLRRLGRTAVVHAIAAWAIIWVFYGLRYSAFAPALAAGATFNHGWGWMLSGIGLPGKIIWWLNEWRLLPEAWLYGLTFVIQFSQSRGAFMSGEYGLTGWVSFFPFAFLIKSTLPFLLLIAGMVIGAATVFVRAILQPRRAARLTDLALGVRPLLPLAVLFAVYWATSLASHLNIGHRHILPTYPVLFILLGWVGAKLDLRRPLLAAGIGGALLWHAGESLRARPHYLAYFNQIVGGSEHGWRHLVDSSLDWGQDLPDLSSWLAQNASGEAVFLSYFGTGDPGYEGIRATALPTIPEVGPPRPWHTLAPGVYAISATMLQHVYSTVRGDWTLAREKEYQQLRLNEPALLAYQAEVRQHPAAVDDVVAASWTTAWKRYEQLRFARLCTYLRVRPADAVIGHSIRIFRLDARELQGAVGGSLQEWRLSLEEAANRGRREAGAK